MSFFAVYFLLAYLYAILFTVFVYGSRICIYFLMNIFGNRSINNIKSDQIQSCIALCSQIYAKAKRKIRVFRRQMYRPTVHGPQLSS